MKRHETIGFCSDPECAYFGALYNEACPKHANYEKGENMNDDDSHNFNLNPAALAGVMNHFHGPQDHNPLLNSTNSLNKESNNMSRFVKTLTKTSLVLLAIFILSIPLRIVGILPPVQGIITLPGESESVLLCFEDCGEPGDVIDLGEDVGTAYCMDYGFIVENVGHNADFKTYEVAAHDLCGFKAQERPWHQRMIGMAGHNHFVKKGEIVVYAVQHPDYLNQGEVGISGTNGAGGFTISPEKVGRHLEECDGDFNLIWK